MEEGGGESGQDERTIGSSVVYGRITEVDAIRDRDGTNGANDAGCATTRSAAEERPAAARQSRTAR